MENIQKIDGVIIYSTDKGGEKVEKKKGPDLTKKRGMKHCYLNNKCLISIRIFT